MARVFVGAALTIFAALAEATAQERADSARSRLAALPVIGSAPETGFQFGAMGLWVYRRGPTTATRPSQLQLLSLATTKNQRRVSLQLDEWSADNSRRLRLRAAYQHFPLPYFGAGGDESEATYTVTGPEFVASLQRRVGEGQYFGAGLRLADTRVTEVDLTDWRSEPPVLEGHGSVTVQVFQVTDSRDQVFGPRTGLFGQLTLSGTRSRDHGVVHRYRTGLRIARDTRGYRPVGRAGGVLAARVAVDLLVGRAALDMGPMAGADTLLRGYVRGRYRNNFVGAVEAEYRSGHWHRLGYAVFMSGGVAAAAVNPYDATLLPAAGGGLRYLLAPAERLAVRVDYGWGRNGGGLYIALGEAF